MRRVTVIALLFVSLVGEAQDYTITNWLDNKKSATVLTFDDWDPSHPGMAVDKMINAGLAGTFFVTIDNAWRTTDYPDMMNAVNNGIEIGNHTKSHPGLSTISAANLTLEVEGAKATLNANVTNQVIHTLAYPLGDYNDAVIDETMIGHIGARTVEGSTNNWGYAYPTTEREYFKIPTIQAGTMVPMINYEWELNQAIAAGGLYTIMYHSVGGLGWFDDIPEATFDAHLAYVKSKEDITWVTTFSNAVRYHKEKHCATLSNISKGAALWSLDLTDTLSDNSIYNQELTVWLALEVGDVVSGVKQNGSAITYSFSASGDSLIFNAVPDGGTIEIDGNLVAALDDEQLANIQIYPNPSNGTLNILMGDYNGNVVVTNELGQEVFTQSTFGSLESVNISHLPSGTYVVQVSTEYGIRREKLIMY